MIKICYISVESKKKTNVTMMYGKHTNKKLSTAILEVTVAVEKSFSNSTVVVFILDIIPE